MCVFVCVRVCGCAMKYWMTRAHSGGSCWRKKNGILCNSNLFSILILIEIIATANAISSDQAFAVQHWEK